MAAVATRSEAPWIFRKLAALNEALTVGFPGGPRAFKMAWVINLQKGGTALFVLALMAGTGNWSVSAWIYLALHGTYGVCWLLKDTIFPDRNWERFVTIGGAINMWLFALGLYWVFPVLLITDVLGPRPEPSAPLLAAAVSLHTLGIVIMMASDTQKHFVLKLRRGLIDDGWFAKVRHPNYLGEMMIYGAYGLLAGHWIAWAILAWVWGAIFASNIAMKEASLSRHPGWDAYQRRSGRLWPAGRRNPGEGTETARPASTGSAPPP
jgi:protein-S-isoprenylcysteine O-methyltransferase Ste14